MTRMFLATVILFVTGCYGGVDSDGSECLQLWLENDEIDPNLVCADNIGEPGDDEFVVYIFDQTNMVFTDSSAFTVVDTFEIIGLFEPGDAVTIECNQDFVHLCTEDESDDLFMMGRYVSWPMVTIFDGVPVQMTCVSNDSVIDH